MLQWRSDAVMRCCDAADPSRHHFTAGVGAYEASAAAVASQGSPDMPIPTAVCSRLGGAMPSIAPPAQGVWAVLHSPCACASVCVCAWAELC